MSEHVEPDLQQYTGPMIREAFHRLLPSSVQEEEPWEYHRRRPRRQRDPLGAAQAAGYNGA